MEEATLVAKKQYFKVKQLSQLMIKEKYHQNFQVNTMNNPPNNANNL